MDKYTDYDKWLSDLDNAETKVKEIRRAIPEYYEFFERLRDLHINNFNILREEPARDHGYEMVNHNIFDDIVKEWMEFPFAESQKIWQLVKDYNSIHSSTGIDGKRIYNKMKEIKNRVKKAVKNA